MDTPTHEPAGREAGEQTITCPYCGDPLSTVKGSPQSNGLHGDCNEMMAEEMNEAYGDVYYINE